MDDTGRPNEHFCPITLQVMKEPVVAADGRSYERDAIVQWLKRSHTSPITGLPLPNNTLFENQALKSLIQEWKPERKSDHFVEGDMQNIPVLQKPSEASHTVATGAQIQLEERLGQTGGLLEANSQVTASLQARSHVLESPEATGISASSSSSSAEVGLLIPPAARGYEAIYERFLKGTLIYRPNPGSDAGMVTLPIRELSNPLEGTFDLSRCGDAGLYLSISTGYRKGKKPENVQKVEIWISPRFLVQKDLDTTAAHFRPIMDSWRQEDSVGLFWTNGWEDDLSLYDYLTTQTMDVLSNDNLYEKWRSVDNRCGSYLMGEFCRRYSVWFRFRV